MKYSLFFLLIFLSTNFFAQQSTIVTDRPTQSYASSTVPAKTIQLETGFWYAHSSAGRVESDYISYNSSVLRWGLLENFELRLGFGYESIKVNSDIKPVNITGWNPLLIGTKIYIAKEQGWRPEIAFVGGLKLPFFGNEGFRPDAAVPNFSFAFSHNLGNRFLLGYNLGLQWPTSSEEDLEGVYTIYFGYKILDRFFCFLENYAFIDSVYAFDGGFIYLISSNFQVDLYGGFGLSPGSPDQFIGAGFSWRIPR